jgi:hypothetical protein
MVFQYAWGGKITHVAVVDPTDWRKRDFKPYTGRLLG